MLPKSFVVHAVACAGVWLAFACPAATGAATSPVGSTNVTTADPRVPRPPGKPCVVQLLPDTSFTDFAPRPYAYAPPTGCGKHWAKVVLEADFSVTAGRQFDRTASLWLGGVNLYFGTTEEPSSTAAPSWHVERDLTDYSALFAAAGSGQAIIGNVVDSTYTGVIHGSARLLFYPTSFLAPPAQVPDAVYPLGSDAVGSTVSLNDSGSQLAKTLSLPRNIARAYLDVFVQSQNADEFWYTCVPDQYAAEVQECGGGNFREAEVSIDGQPVGVAPVYPWIYTGGIDPYLWRPITGVQTLNFMPYRVDLTPFAGVLSDGAPHQVALSVAGAANYFSATASLLVYRDPQVQQVSGQIVRNTLAGQLPTPAISDSLQTDGSGNVSGDITTSLSRHFVIEGYADTSRGRVHTTVDQTVGFADTQTFTINDSDYHQVTNQLTSVDGNSSSRIGNFVVREYREKLSYPLQLDIDEQFASDGGFALKTHAHQGYAKHEEHRLLGVTLYSASISNGVASDDTLDFDAGGNLTAHSGQADMQGFVFDDSLGGCHHDAVSAVGDVVTSYETGIDCPHHRDHVYWFTHPDGSPDNGGGVPGI
jgi:hypothetical protein